MATLVFDTFTGANGTDISAHTPDTDVIGGGWLDNGVNTVELDGTGAVKFAANTDSARIDVGTTDQIVKGRFNAGGVDNRFQLVARSNNSPPPTSITCYSFNIRSGATGDNIFIQRRIAGSGTDLVGAAFSFNLSTTYEIELSVIGSDLVAKIDGVSVLSTTDSSITTGNYAGFYHALYTDGNARFYDFQANDASLGGQGFKKLRGIEVPPMTGSPTETNVPMLVKPNIEFDAAMLAKLDVSGGDLRFSSDIAGNTQLPCQIVDGLNVVWVLVPSVAAGNKIYVWGDKTGESQPAASAAFGSQAVWVDDTRRYHMDGDTGDLIDAKGVQNAVKTGTSLAGAAVASYGSSVDLNNSAYYSLSDPAEGQSVFSASGWLLSPPAESGKSRGIFSAWTVATGGDGGMSIMLFTNSSDNLAFRVRNASGTVVTVDTSSLSPIQGSNAATQWVASYDGSNIKLFINGSEAASSSIAGNIATSSAAFEIGRYNSDPVRVPDSLLQELRFKQGVLSANQIAIEYDNQSTTGAWWIAEDAGGAINVTGTTPSYSYSAVNGTVDLTPEITVTGATPSYTYSAISGTVETPGTISVTGATPGYSYAPVTGSVSLFGTVTVTGETPNFTYTALSGRVSDGIEVYTNSFVGFDKEPLTYTGYVKTNTFSGIISKQSDFSGIIKNITFTGVLK